MKNGLDANIKSMTQAEKTMLRYQYVMANSTRAQQDFQRTQNTWHNQLTILKQQLQQLAAVIGSGLIQAIKPFVMQMNAALSGLIKFAQNVVNALGKIFGWEMEVNTKGLTIDDDALEDIDTSGLDNIADGADNATQAVKKLKDQLQGFDKLNVLRTTTKNPTSGKNGKDSGSGASGTGAVSDGDITAGLKKTKGVFESNIDNLFDLGRYISNSLAKQLEKINWSSVYEKARNFGKGLAQFLNGLITPRLFEDVGKTISKSISAAFHFLDSFGQEFNWANFGKSIGAGINGYLKGFDWITIFSAAIVWGKGLATTINNAVKETDFKLLGKTLANQIRTGLLSLYDFADTLDWEEIGYSIAEAVNGFVENFPASKLSGTINKWVQGLRDVVVTAIGNISWDKVQDKIVEMIKGLDFDTIAILVGGFTLLKAASFTVALSEELKKAFMKQLVQKLFGGMLKLSIPDIIVELKNISWMLPGTPSFDVGATAILETLWSWIYKLMPKSWSDWYDSFDKFIKETVIGGFFNILETHLKKIFSWENTLTIWDDAKENFKKGGGYILAGIAEGLIAVPGFFLEPIGNLFKTLWDDLCSAFGISSPAEKMKPIGKYIVQGIIEGFKIPDIKGATKDIKDKIFDIVGTAKTKFDEMKTDVGKKIGDLKTNAGGAVNILVSVAKTQFESMRSDLASKMSSIKSNATEKWGSIKNTISQYASSAKNTVTSAWGTLKTNTTSAWSSIKSKTTEVWSSIKSAITDKMSSAKTAVKNAIDKIKGYFKFSWSLPKLKMPHPYVSGSFSLNPPSVPTFGIEWYKKAYDNPFMFTKPTLMPDIKGFGDGNGGEMVYGHANLMNDIREASGSNEMTNIGNRQLANDQRIIQLLTVIAEKEFGISADSIYSVVKEKDSDFFTRSGKSAFSY